MTGQGGNRQNSEYPDGEGLPLSPKREQNQNPTPVACRMCGAVFMENWALIDHVGVHMGLDEASSRMRSETNRLSYPRDPTVLNPNPPCYYVSVVSSRPTRRAQHGYLVPTTRREMNSFVGGINLVGALPSANTPRGDILVDRGDFYQFRPMSVPSLAPQASKATPKDPPGDPTKPFLDQLERRLTMEKNCRDARKDVCNTNSSSAVLDLTLKL